jgi:hypothetical protein
MVLAAFLFMRRMAKVTNVHAGDARLADAAEDGYDSDPVGVRRRSISKDDREATPGARLGERPLQAR